MINVTALTQVSADPDAVPYPAIRGDPGNTDYTALDPFQSNDDRVGDSDRFGVWVFLVGDRAATRRWWLGVNLTARRLIDEQWLTTETKLFD
jgi:hypothetical protein